MSDVSHASRIISQSKLSELKRGRLKVSATGDAVAQRIKVMKKGKCNRAHIKVD